MKVNLEGLKSVVENRYEETNRLEPQGENSYSENVLGRLKPSMRDTFRLVEGHKLYDMGADRIAKPDPWPGELYSYKI